MSAFVKLVLQHVTVFFIVVTFTAASVSECLKSLTDVSSSCSWVMDLDILSQWPQPLLGSTLVVERWQFGVCPYQGFFVQKKAPVHRTSTYRHKKALVFIIKTNLEAVMKNYNQSTKLSKYQASTTSASVAWFLYFTPTSIAYVIEDANQQGIFSIYVRKNVCTYIHTVYTYIYKTGRSLY